METFAICNSRFKENVKCLESIDFQICGNTIPVAILDVDQVFNEIPDHNVAVKIDAFSCNYRDKSAFLLFHEKCQNLSVTGNLYYYPFGSEFVGKVIAVGEKVKELKIGDRVIPDGAYPLKTDNTIGGLPTNSASQRIQLFKETYLKKVPPEMPDEVAAAFTIAGQTVYSMLRKLDLKSGQNILVTAATSNTSLATIIALRKYGVNVYACSSSYLHEDRLLQLGVKQVLLKESLETRSKELFPDDFNGFDAVVDPFFDIYLPIVQKFIKNEGKYITCGLYKQHRQFEEQQNLLEKGIELLLTCISHNITIIGNCLGNTTDLDMAIEDYKNGKFKIIIDSIWDSKNLLPFLQKTFHQNGRFGKVVFKYD